MGKPVTPDVERVDEPAIDYESLLTRCMQDASRLRVVVQKFEAKSARMREQLLAVFEAGDVASTTRQAHALRGTALTLSATRLAKLSAELEAVDDAASLVAAEATVKQIGQELERCRVQLRNMPQVS